MPIPEPTMDAGAADSQHPSDGALQGAEDELGAHEADAQLAAGARHDDAARDGLSRK